MLELKPGWTTVLDRIVQQGVVQAGAALLLVAEAVEREARAKASNGQHAYGTPTPASPGQGPAEISGTLKDSIGHTTPVKDLLGWEMKVGPRTGFTPPYGRNPTPADRYGYYLETGLRNGDTYPWLKPAVESVRPEAGPVFARMFNEIAWLKF